jgi:hypothetical protein
MRTLIRSLVAAAFLLSAGAAFAQESGDSGSKGTKTEYKKTTKYDFDDDIVEGELVKPDGEFTGARQKTKHSSLIKIRENFVPEMLKSINDV